MARPVNRWLNLWENTKAFGLATIVHILAAALIVLGTINWKPFKPTQLTGMTIEAVMIDTQALKQRRDDAQREAEAAVRREQVRQQRERDLAAQKQREERQAIEEVDRQRQAEIEAEQQRQREETQRKREAELRLQQLREQQERDRQEKLAQQQQELEDLRNQREEVAKQRRLEEERLKQLADRREAEEMAKRQADAEAELQRQATAEQAALRAGQVADLRTQYAAAIQAQVTNNWLRPPTARPGLSCTLRIVQIPGGEVISAAIAGVCNGDEATRRSLLAAVERAGSLPYRGFEDVFEREIDFKFRYDGE